MNIFVLSLGFLVPIVFLYVHEILIVRGRVQKVNRYINGCAWFKDFFHYVVCEVDEAGGILITVCPILYRAVYKNWQYYFFEGDVVQTCSPEEKSLAGSSISEEARRDAGNLWKEYLVRLSRKCSAL